MLGNIAIALFLFEDPDKKLACGSQGIGEKATKKYLNESRVVVK